MRRLDGHIHIVSATGDAAPFLERLGEAGMAGGLLISRPPVSFPSVGVSGPAGERVGQVVGLCSGLASLYPFYWIDPLEADAMEQVAVAVEGGVSGFKIICDRFEPGDERVLRVCAVIAQAGLPVLFHSGILWDGKASSRFNRPVLFENLLGVDGLRFALAHVGWPWCDEAIAVFGKMLNARGTVKMYVDTTPGTPVPYRREVLTKLFQAGYDVAGRVVFGSDGTLEDYNVGWVRQWVERDEGILREMGLGDGVAARVFGQNLEAFVTGRETGESVAVPERAR